MTSKAKDIIGSWCNSCGKETDHDVAHRETLSSFDYPDFAVETRSVVARCRGCKDLSIRNETWHFDLTPDESNEGAQLTELTFAPPRLWRRAPDWLQQLEEVQPDLADILTEVYLAMNDKQVRLLATGVRTALDHVMNQIVGDVGDFPRKLDEMVAKEHLTPKQSEMLASVIDAASAAAHRGFKPNKPLLQEMVITMETVIRDHYVTGPLLKEMKKLIPPRPPRAKSTPS